jgi:hypothetical protein
MLTEGNGYIARNLVRQHVSLEPVTCQFVSRRSSLVSREIRFTIDASRFLALRAALGTLRVYAVATPTQNNQTT